MGSICMLMAIAIQPEFVEFIRKVYYADTEEKVENRGRPKGAKNKPKKEVKLPYMVAVEHATASLQKLRNTIDKLSGIHDVNTEIDVDEVRKGALDSIESVDYVIKCLKNLCTPSEAILIAYRGLDNHLTDLYEVTREACGDQLEDTVCDLFSKIDACMDMFKTLYGTTN